MSASEVVDDHMGLAVWESPTTGLSLFVKLTPEEKSASRRVMAFRADRTKREE